MMSRLPITITFSIVAVAVAGMSMVASAGNSLRPRSPEVAALLPGETQARVNVFNKLQAAGKRMPSGAGAAARAALRSDPLDSTALRLLMDSTAGPTLSPRKLELATLAGRLSRRDGRIRLVLFEDAARNNRPRDVLQNLDAVLRVTPESQGQVFPMLKGVLPSKDFRAHLSPYLGKRSPWMIDFVLYAANDALSVGNMADVVIRSGKAMAPQDAAYIVPHLISRTIEAREYSKVPPLLALITKTPAALTASERWTSVTTDNKYGLAAWQAASNATTSASFMSEDKNGYRPLSVYAASGARDVAVSKFLLLKPGAYQLSQEITIPEVAQEPAAQWRLKCVGRTRDETIWTSGNFLVTAQRKFKYPITVPADCNQQILELGVAVDFEAPPVELTIDQFRLVRTSPEN